MGSAQPEWWRPSPERSHLQSLAAGLLRPQARGGPHRLGADAVLEDSLGVDQGQRSRLTLRLQRAYLRLVYSLEIAPETCCL